MDCLTHRKHCSNPYYTSLTYVGSEVGKLLRNKTNAIFSFALIYNDEIRPVILLWFAHWHSWIWNIYIYIWVTIYVYFAHCEVMNTFSWAICWTNHSQCFTDTGWI